MKEIIALVRMNAVQHTRDALAEKGYPAMVVTNVMGRGRQKGLHYEMHASPNGGVEVGTLHFLPKRMISIVVADNQADDVIQTIIDVNQTGNIGDGKIFVCPVAEVIRIRTREHGARAIA